MFYGWWMVAAGGVLNALSAGTYMTGFSVYFLPVTREFGLTRAATSLAYGMGRLEGGFEGPLAGYLVDRLGPRKMIAFGGSLAGIGFILLSLTQNFTTFLLVYISVLALGMNAGFNHSIMAAINQWFIRRKGLAMSILTMGQSIGGFVITPLVAVIVLNVGWRTGALISGLAIIAAVIPLSFVMRRTPEEVGLLPDGDRGPTVARVDTSSGEPARFSRHVTAVDFTAKEAFRTRTFWLLALAMGLRSSAHTGVFVHLVPLMVWKGQTEATGALVVAFVAFTTFPLRAVLGWTGDKWAKHKIVGITMGLGAASLGMLIVSGGTLWQLLMFAALFSFAEAVNGIAWSLLGDFFGRGSFATIRGGITMAQGFASMGTPVFAGWVYDTTGSYYSALMPLIALYLGAGVLFWTLPKARHPGRVADPPEARASAR
jgi:MFS family permease